MMVLEYKNYYLFFNYFSEFKISLGAFHLRSPTGGFAYGISS
jgi:hypothetical protein